MSNSPERTLQDTKHYRKVLQRLIVLCDYGFDMSSLPRDEIDKPEFLSDEWLEQWFGKGFLEGDEVKDAIVDEFTAIDLVDGFMSGARNASH